MWLLALYVIAFELIAPFLEQANYTSESVAWARQHVVYVYDTSLRYNEGYCDCEPDPKIVHIAALSLDLYRVQHETEHAWGQNYDRVALLQDTQMLSLQSDKVGTLAKEVVARALGPRREYEHLSTHIIEGLNYKIGAVPEWYRMKNMSSRKVVYTVQLPLVLRSVKHVQSN